MRGEPFFHRDCLLQRHAAQFVLAWLFSSLSIYWSNESECFWERARLYIKSAAHKLLISISLAALPRSASLSSCVAAVTAAPRARWESLQACCVLCCSFPGLRQAKLFPFSCCFHSLRQFCSATVKVADVKLQALSAH